MNLDQAIVSQLQEAHVTQVTMLYKLACEKNNFFVMKLVFEILYEFNAIDTKKVPLAALFEWATKSKDDVLRDQILKYHVLPLQKLEESCDRKRGSLYFFDGSQEKRLTRSEEDSDLKKGV